MTSFTDRARLLRADRSLACHAIRQVRYWVVNQRRDFNRHIRGHRERRHRLVKDFEGRCIPNTDVRQPTDDSPDADQHLLFDQLLPTSLFLLPKDVYLRQRHGGRQACVHSEHEEHTVVTF